MKKIILLLVLMSIVMHACNQQPVVPEIETQNNVPEMALGDERFEYKIDSGNSALKYSASRIGGKPHTGQVTVSSGSLVTEEGNIQSGDFVMDMDTITDDGGSQKYLGHVKSDDFFGVNLFPESAFSITQAVANGEDFTITGDLTIRDQTHTISFPATIVVIDSELAVEASFSIDRTLWGITFDSSSFFQNLGDRAIRDEIEFILDLEFVEQ